MKEKPILQPMYQSKGQKVYKIDDDGKPKLINLKCDVFEDKTGNISDIEFTYKNLYKAIGEKYEPEIHNPEDRGDFFISLEDYVGDIKMFVLDEFDFFEERTIFLVVPNK